MSVSACKDMKDLRIGVSLMREGTLDIMIQRSGEQDQGTMTFVKNNFYHDAFFLRAQGELARCHLGVRRPRAS